MKIKEKLTNAIQFWDSPNEKNLCHTYIQKLKDALAQSNDEQFMNVIKELTDKHATWIHFKSSDLYYWIEVLNYIDDQLRVILSKLGMHKPDPSSPEESKDM